MPDKYVITIGRSFGSGGRLVGQIIADRLGIGFYDKKLLSLAAEKSGLNHDFARDNDERMPRIFGTLLPFPAGGYYPSGLFGSSPASGPDSIYSAQCEFIHELAMSEPCVLVGRSADYVLRDVPNVVNVFVHAPLDDCARRTLERGEAADMAQARATVLRINKLRANFYNFYTDKKWGAACSYDLCVDSSTMPLDTLADFIIEYARHKLAAKP